MNRLYLPNGFRDPLWLEKQLKTRPEKDWRRLGQRRAMALFHEMSARVPAYKDFLKKHKVDPTKIRTVKDFAQLPTVNKDNYLRKYPREALCWDGEFKNKSWTVSTTSGSTGRPYYFPRENSQDWQYAMMAELYLRANFDIAKLSTLYIVAFPMGAWIGGDFDQILIGSYAPFLKDILDDGKEAEINWHDYKLGFIFSAEGFNELFS